MEHLASRRNIWYTLSLLVILPGLISLLTFGTQARHRLHRRHALGTAVQPLDHDRSRSRTCWRGTAYTDTTVQLSDARTACKSNVAIIRMKELQEGSPIKKPNSPTRLTPLRSGRSSNCEISSVGRSSATRSATAPFWRWRSPRSASCSTSRYAFRNTQNPVLSTASARSWRCCTTCWWCLGIFSILGWALRNVEIDALFVTAVLTSSASRSTTPSSCSTASARIWPDNAVHRSRRSSTTAWPRPLCARSTPR